MIVSNPPYIPTLEVETLPTREIGTLQPEVRDYEPRLALETRPDLAKIAARMV